MRLLLRQVLAASVLLAARGAPGGGSRNHQYLTEDLLGLCPADGSKREVRLGTKTSAAVFTLSDDSLDADFTCHLELEAPSAEYGFHVFLEELHLFDDNSERGRCPDYVQFARDELFLTTYKSPPYCGRDGNSNERRFYVEDKDREMDLLVRLDGSSSDAARQHPRSLTVVVTLFKKSCGSKDPDFRRCGTATNHCVRRELLCDGRSNCLWPSGDGVATDEEDCEGHGSSGEISGSPPGANNIPIILVVAVVVVAVVLGFVVAVVKLYGAVKRRPRRMTSSAATQDGLLLQRDRQQQQQQQPQQAQFNSGRLSTTSCAEDVAVTDVIARVHLPPTYEEALISSSGDPGNLNGGPLSSNPPAYTASYSSRH